MSKVASSPTARLLQSSRLFSLPRPLPVQPELTTGLYRTSDTATTAHPTHQAITTPASSYSRGDWGLKRPIPSGRTNSKKRNPDRPTIRVRANDTYEHITDFASAGDHVRTERKWAQMEVPFIHQSSRKSRYSHDKGGLLSVYEEWLDNTDPEAKLEEKSSVSGQVQTQETRRTMQRWKHSGPWLGGMQDGEFEQYLKNILPHAASGNSRDAPAKMSWQKFVSNKFVEEKQDAARREARNPENPMSEEQARDLMAAAGEKPTPDELKDFQKRLRDDHASQGLSSSLTAFICEFLDLPSVYSPPTAPTRFDPAQALQLASLTDSDSGPPTTHPSAALSHLRTNAIMHNHPIYGPQKEKTPIEARVVRPRTKSGQILEHLAKLGVGGVVAEDSVSATNRSADPNAARSEDRMAHALDENIEGGNKLWVQPETAHIDHRSRIRLSVSRAGQEAVAVKTGDEAKIGEIYEAKNGRTASAPVKSAFLDLPDMMRSGSASSKSSGIRTGQPRRYTGITGFDAELRGGT